MKHFKFLVSMCSVLVLITALHVNTARADEWNEKTYFTFSAPFEVPGYKGPMVLPAGTYEFKLLDSLSDRDIVQIFNKNQNHLYTTVLAIPDSRLKPTGKSVIQFEERASGSPQAIKAWFYPGMVSGQEFVYPKSRAVELAKSTNEPVLSIPDETALNMSKPIKTNQEAAVKAMEKAPVMAENPSGQESQLGTVVTQPSSASQVQPSTTVAENTLPKTASDMPLLALCGILLASVGIALRKLSRGVA